MRLHGPGAAHGSSQAWPWSTPARSRPRKRPPTSLVPRQHSLLLLPLPPFSLSLSFPAPRSRSISPRAGAHSQTSARTSFECIGLCGGTVDMREGDHSLGSEWAQLERLGRRCGALAWGGHGTKGEPGEVDWLRVMPRSATEWNRKIWCRFVVGWGRGRNAAANWFRLPFNIPP